MVAKTKRDGDYWLKRIELENPAVFADFLAGMFKSINAAPRAAGMFSARTPLHELKNAWGKASPAQRRSFVIWAGAVPAVAVPTAAITGGVAIDRLLQPSAARRIAEIMTIRGMTTGGVMAEMGFSAMNPSLGNALKGGWRLQPAVITAVEKWLTANARI